MLIMQEGETATPEEPISMYQQALLSWGNLQYEESQMVAVAGGDWRAVLDEATAHFREAGCNEADIRGALVRASFQGALIRKRGIFRPVRPAFVFSRQFPPINSFDSTCIVSQTNRRVLLSSAAHPLNTARLTSVPFPHADSSC